MVANNLHHITASADDAGLRLDKFLADQIPGLSRTRVQTLLETNYIQVIPYRELLASTKVKQGDAYTIIIPEPEPALPLPQDLALDIVFEDEDLLVVNKPTGLVVHPAPGHTDKTLVNGILAHCGEQLSGIGGIKRPGIVHRLDKDTSGLMVIAKNDFAHHHLSGQFSDRTLSRTYHALVWGMLTPKEGQIHSLIGRSPHNRQKMAVVTKNGKEAITHYRVLKTFRCQENLSVSISQVECKLQTGRTHQIRVHLHHLGHSIIGDPLYGHAPKTAKKFWPEAIINFPHQLLHACQLKFVHPRSEKVLTFTAPYPESYNRIIKFLEKNVNM
jgi:23S rRNA pseudouridine1911/1915/1917 synthase